MWGLGLIQSKFLQEELEIMFKKTQDLEHIHKDDFLFK